jgi:hypothetical protein
MRPCYQNLPKKIYLFKLTQYRRHSILDNSPFLRFNITRYAFSNPASDTAYPGPSGPC